MAGDVKSGMNLGGGASKVRAVADLTAEYTKLNQVLEKTEKLSKSIEKSLKAASGKGGGGTDSMSGMNLPPITGGGTGASTAGIPMMSPGKGDFTSMSFQGPGAGKLQVTTPTGFVDQKAPGFGSQVWNGIKSNIGSLVATTGAGAVQAINPADFVTNDVARRRFGFYAGDYGTTAGSNAFRSMMAAGSPTSSLDAANAAMAGASNGLMPGLKNYSTIGGSAAFMSNLTPGVGLEGSMNALASLNSAQSVNKLRMIGINVRDDKTGMMRSFKDIAEQLWNHLTVRGSSPVTAEDLSLSLQSGNTLDSMMNQYFGNDPILRQQVISYLYQKVSGKPMTKAGLKATGANPEVAQSFGRRNNQSYRALDKYTDAGVAGVTAANDIIAGVAQTFADASGVFKSAVDIFVGAVSGGETLAGGANGGFGTIMGGAASFLGGALIKPAFNAIKGGLGKIGPAIKGGLGKVGPTIANAGKNVVSGASRVAPWLTGANILRGGAITAEIAAILSLSGDSRQWTDEEKAEWARTHNPDGSTKAEYMLPAGTGPLKPGYTPPAQPNNSLNDLFNRGGQGGDGAFGIGGASLTEPVSGFSNKITSRWGQVRHLVIKGKSVTTKPHGGMDIGVPKGTNVFAVKDGTVIHSGDNPAGFGRNLVIQNDDGLQTVYAHLDEKLVDQGQKVTAGSLIGKSGNTGFSTGDHLHFQVQRRMNASLGDTIDPAAYLSGAVVKPVSGLNDGPEASSAAADSRSLWDTAKTSLFNTGGQGGDMGGSSTTTYGGVTVNINLPSGTQVNEEKLAREVKRILEDEEQIRMAVVR